MLNAGITMTSLGVIRKNVTWVFKQVLSTNAINNFIYISYVYKLLIAVYIYYILNNLYYIKWRRIKQC